MFLHVLNFGFPRGGGRCVWQARPPLAADFYSETLLDKVSINVVLFDRFFQLLFRVYPVWQW